MRFAPGLRALARRLAPLPVLLVFAAGTAVAQAPAETYTNLKVLPKDVTPAELRATMNGFTRALGVRCIYCHVGQEGKPFRHEDFALDDKVTKVKARAMMQMAHDINEKYLSQLPSPASPPVHVQCATCHHGATLPRTLQDVLLATYDAAGIDSTVQQYGTLRDRYYGRAVYDFGEVPLGDVAGRLQGEGHLDDALRMATLNVDKNPASTFAKRQHAVVSLDVAYAAGGAPQGTHAFHELQGKYGDKMVNDALLNEVGYGFLGAGKTDVAVEVFRSTVDLFPTSANAWDSLGEGLLAKGDRKKARDAYRKSLALDPTNDNAKAKLDEIAGKKKT